MGAKSKLNVSECREVVLSLLGREEPAGVPARGRFGLCEAAIEKICRLVDPYGRIRIWRFEREKSI